MCLKFAKGLFWVCRFGTAGVWTVLNGALDVLGQVGGEVGSNAAEDRLSEDTLFPTGGAGINGYRLKGALSAHRTGGAPYGSEVHPEPDVRTVIAAVGRGNGRANEHG